MTIEQKAKAYDKALSWMRELYPGLHGATKEDAEHYFPELRESDDERVCKAIDEILKLDEAWQIAGNYGLTVVNIRKYLEKQKEQKPVEHSVKEDEYWHGFNEGKGTVLDNPGEYGLCKSAEWSEEDERILKGIIGKIDHDQTYGVSKAEMLSFIKSLRPSWKPSEEQMGALRKFFIEGVKALTQTDCNAINSIYLELKTLIWKHRK